MTGFVCEDVERRKAYRGNRCFIETVGAALDCVVNQENREVAQRHVGLQQ